jgi:hypothetical protein
MIFPRGGRRDKYLDVVWARGWEKQAPVVDDAAGISDDHICVGFNTLENGDAFPERERKKAKKK